jgi:proteic killer suppression protein
VPILKIEFRNRKLERACNSAKELRKEYGTRMADKVQQRLAELAAAETLDDMRHLPAARCHELTGNLKGKLAVDLVHPYRLLFLPNHTPKPQKSDGGLDWCRVSSILVDDIGDYH